MARLTDLSDSDLLHGLCTLVGSQRRVMANIVAYLGELDARQLHLKKGFSSLFSYCVDHLSFSEDEACRRIEAARLTRRFPHIGELLESGAVTLTVLGLLKPHLTEENHRELLLGVSGASVRQAKEWLAARFPLPDVPSSIRRCPEAPRQRASDEQDKTGEAGFAHASGPGLESPAPTRIGGAASESPLPDASSSSAPVGGAIPPLLTPQPSASRSELPALTRIGPAAPESPLPTHSPPCAPGSLASPPPASPARVDPLSRDRFLVKLTVSRSVKEKLELARDLMRHQNPNGDLAAVVERALDALLAELASAKLGQTKHPQSKPRSARPARITSATRREVVDRDGLRCSFVAPDGRRCETQAFLEFDHEKPKGCGGGSEASNVRILCRAHNHLAAERAYGAEHMRRALSNARTKKTTIAGERGDNCWDRATRSRERR